MFNFEHVIAGCVCPCPHTALSTFRNNRNKNQYATKTEFMEVMRRAIWYQSLFGVCMIVQTHANAC